MKLDIIGTLWEKVKSKIKIKEKRKLLRKTNV